MMTKMQLIFALIMTYGISDSDAQKHAQEAEDHGQSVIHLLYPQPILLITHNAATCSFELWRKEFYKGMQR